MTGQAACHCEEAEAIRHLLAEYGRLLDLRDASTWSKLFAPDGEWVGGEHYGVIAGREQLAGFIAREFTQSPPCVHIFGNSAITVDDGGTQASAWSRWLLVEQADEGLRAALAGSYSDRLVKLAEGWRFRRREVTLDLPRG